MSQKRSKAIRKMAQIVAAQKGNITAETDYFEINPAKPILFGTRLNAKGEEVQEVFQKEYGTLGLNPKCLRKITKDHKRLARQGKLVVNYK